jgi:hypothetical protein
MPAEAPVTSAQGFEVVSDEVMGLIVVPDSGGSN